MKKGKKTTHQHSTEIFNDPVKMRKFEKDRMKNERYVIWANKFGSAMVTYTQEVEVYLNHYRQQLFQQNSQFSSPQILQEYNAKYNTMFNFFTIIENFF